MVARGSFFLFIFHFCVIHMLCAQRKIEPEKRSLTPNEKVMSARPLASHVLIIPFDSKLYMSEIDRNIWKETGMTFNQIRNVFRQGLAKAVESAMKRNYTAVSLLSDSNKTVKDLAYIYKSISYSYDPIPSEKNIGQQEGPGVTKEKGDTRTSPKIVNGELVVGANYDKRFMNTVLSNPYLLPYLHKKYKSNVFVFINELDIKNDLSTPYNAKTDSYRREITVHYSIFDNSGKQLTAGIATNYFSPGLNDPKKIVDNHFTSVAKTITSKLVESLSNQQKQPVPKKQ